MSPDQDKGHDWQETVKTVFEYNSVSEIYQWVDSKTKILESERASSEVK